LIGYVGRERVIPAPTTPVDGVIEAAAVALVND
jgi:hypothetical protein